MKREAFATAKWLKDRERDGVLGRGSQRATERFLPHFKYSEWPLLVLESAVTFVTDDRKSQTKTAYLGPVPLSLNK